MTVYQTVPCLYSNHAHIGLVPTRDTGAFYSRTVQTPAIAFRDRRREIQDGAT